jgi:hypothetical protein
MSSKIPPGRQQLSNQFERRAEEHPLRVTQDQLPAQRGEEVRLAPSRQPEGKDVDGAVDKAAIDQRRKLPPDFRRQFGLVERAEGLGLGQSGFGQQPGRAPLRAFDRLAFAEVPHHLPVAPALPFRPQHHLFILTGHGRQPERAQQHLRGVVVCAHAATS